MPRKPRVDGPGAILHVVNRAVGRRTLFESPADARYFESRLAHQVRAGRIRLHAHTLQPNHFHLLLTSVTGQVSEAMRWMQDYYARWFNRRRQRDGHLFKGRFWSEVIESSHHFVALVPYMDANAIRAGLVTDSRDYPYGSARHYARPKGPVWLDRRLVEDAGLAVPVFADDQETKSWHEWVARRCRVARVEPDPLPDLLCAAPGGTLEWYRERARVADGAPAVLVLARPETLLAVLAEGPRLPDCGVLTAGLLRETAGLTYPEIALRLGISPTTARARTFEHRRLMLGSTDYGQMAVYMLRAALTIDFPAPRIPDHVFAASRRLLGTWHENAENSGQVPMWRGRGGDQEIAVSE